jgi:hypothetical protein
LIVLIFARTGCNEPGPYNEVYLALQAVTFVPKFLYRYGGGDFALTGLGPKALLVSR